MAGFRAPAFRFAITAPISEGAEREHENRVQVEVIRDVRDVACISPTGELERSRC